MIPIVSYAKRFQYPKVKELKVKNLDVDVKNPQDTLFDLIFGVDPTTGLPVGDLSFYLGDKTNPEIKAFIQDQLLRENSISDGLSNLPTEVTNKFRTLSDDDVALFSRNHDESNEEYAYRIRYYLSSERERRAAEKKQKEIDTLLHGDSVK